MPLGVTETIGEEQGRVAGILLHLLQCIDKPGWNRHAALFAILPKLAGYL